MKTKKYYYLSSLAIIFLAATFWINSEISKKTPDSDLSQSPKEVILDDVPFQISIPDGWSFEKISLAINTIKGGGPMDAIWVRSPNLIEGPDLTDPWLEFDWFNFNPQASLDDVVKEAIGE